MAFGVKNGSENVLEPFGIYMHIYIYISVYIHVLPDLSMAPRKGGDFLDVCHTSHFPKSGGSGGVGGEDHLEPFKVTTLQCGGGRNPFGETKEELESA